MTVIVAVSWQDCIVFSIRSSSISPITLLLVLLLSGYFAVWAMVICAVQHCGATQHVKEGVQSLSSLAGLGLAAIIMIIAISFAVSDDLFRGNAIYTVVLSCFTVLLVAGVMYVERKEGLNFPAVYQFYALAVFAIMWVVAACLVTFDGPFVVSERDEGEERHLRAGVSVC